MNYSTASQFEHLFWLQVLGDHSRFILNTLSPNEVEHIQQAHLFIQHYDQLLAHARSLNAVSANNWVELAQQAQLLTEQFRMFKLRIIAEHLECKIVIGLSPSFINHMVNELDEYLRVLGYLMRGEAPPKVHPVHHHHLWLLDAAGHAGAIKGELDVTEKKLSAKAKEFMQTFEDFFIKAQEMAGFLRARQDLFPSLQQFNKDASLEITLFYHFIRELEELRIDCRALGTLMPLMADHMAREECYYLTKLYELDPQNVEMLACDPTAPRREG